MSHDFEDIVYVLENRSTIWNELKQPEEVKAYLRYEFSHLLSLPHLNEWLDAPVERGTIPATLVILEELKAFCS